MRSRTVALAAALAVAAVVVAAAMAAKPPSGSSTGLGSVFVSNPVQSLGDESLTDQKDADAAPTRSSSQPHSTSPGRR